MIGHNHTTDPTMTEALATTKDIHHTPHPTTTAVCVILQLINALGGTHAGTHHISITITHLDHATFPTGVTLKVIPQTKTNLARAMPTILLEDYT